MFLFRRPSEPFINQYLLDQRDVPLTYPDVGRSKDAPNVDLPAGFTVDHHRQKLGEGEATFERARAALNQWQVYPQPFTELCFNDRRIQTGNVVAVMINVGPIWSLNPIRIVYTMEDERVDGNRIVGFAIGTLPDHAECGEERFQVEWHRADDSVWYDLLAFSRPYHVLAKCFYPYTRYMQRRFRTLSASSMLAACADPAPELDD